MQGKYLLDSCIFVELMHNNSNVAKRIIDVGANNCYMSIITYYELFYGAYNAPDKYRDNEIAKVRMIVKQFKVSHLPTTEDFAKTKVNLIKTGEYIGDADTMIALTAIANKMIMVTNNIKHFQRIKDLKIESWR